MNPPSEATYFKKATLSFTLSNYRDSFGTPAANHLHESSTQIPWSQTTF